MTDRKFYRAIFKVEVLSEEPFDDLHYDLHDIANSIDNGDDSGTFYMESNEVVDGTTAARLLAEQGSDPEFFNLDDKGNDVEGYWDGGEVRYFRFEFDLGYTGGNYSDVGDFAYVPESMVNELGEKGAFTATTGHDAIHIIHWIVDELYTKDGELIERE